MLSQAFDLLQPRHPGLQVKQLARQASTSLALIRHPAATPRLELIGIQFLTHGSYRSLQWIINDFAQRLPLGLNLVFQLHEQLDARARSFWV